MQYKEFAGTEQRFCQIKAESLTSRLKILKRCQLHGAWPRRTSRAQSVIKNSIFSHANWACSTQFPNVKKVNAASIEQGNKADSAIQSIQGNGKIIQPDFNRSVVITPENIGAVPLERCVGAQDMSRRGARAGYVALKFYTNN